MDLTIIQALSAAPVVHGALMGVIGACLASFGNVVAHRLPRIMEREFKAEAREILDLPAEDTPPLTLSTPPSSCPSCGKLVRAWENVPVLGWLFLRGKCSGCGGRISPAYPLFEALGAVAGVACSMAFAPGFPALSALLICIALAVLVRIDLEHMLLPDVIVLPLLWGGLATSCLGGGLPPKMAVLGAVTGWLALWLPSALFKLLRGVDGMGRGDMKLLAALGAWTGPLSIVPIVLMSGIFGLLMAVTKRGDEEGRFPFGPAIAAAGAVQLFFGARLMALWMGV